MSSMDCLQPPLTPPQREIVKSYGGWTQFMLAFGLKPWEREDEEEGLRILVALTDNDDDDDEEDEDEN
ncbi:hypothetical protein BO70DRAFT_425794 [Aspergillus heteromorphus CBS 117.55]|uniref:Uncharacterized protein n=1 Tax=Aspergillus heteromorphus CBS 117.55 TaxID=1448321 RepID=A0A317X2T4_9EURO|nr:uncharacterized protein BO70DRAFT_425794 [Aspergillus heteromorphus CBS 117.55]PWY90860.1 hypothetical protein BO70DRAFT_425794 [Aspergillus heteromorphus CBS 117.55]